MHTPDTLSGLTLQADALTSTHTSIHMHKYFTVHASILDAFTQAYVYTNVDINIHTHAHSLPENVPTRSTQNLTWLIAEIGMHHPKKHTNASTHTWTNTYAYLALHHV